MMNTTKSYTELENHKELLDTLSFRWEVSSYSWLEVAAFCQGAAMASENLNLNVEMVFLNQIAWTLHELEE